MHCGTVGAPPLAAALSAGKSVGAAEARAPLEVTAARIATAKQRAREVFGKCMSFKMLSLGSSACQTQSGQRSMNGFFN
jgi:hypothetical protein